jgi:hypothetical protein
MANIKFSELPQSPDLLGLDYIVGIRDNEDTTFTNYIYPATEFMAYVTSLSRKMITVASDGTEITDSWIDGKSIQAIITNGQAYLLDVDYTQAGDTLSGVGISFYTSQKVLLIA